MPRIIIRETVGASYLYWHAIIVTSNARWNLAPPMLFSTNDTVIFPCIVSLHCCNFSRISTRKLTRNVCSNCASDKRILCRHNVALSVHIYDVTNAFIHVFDNGAIVCWTRDNRSVGLKPGLSKFHSAYALVNCSSSSFAFLVYHQAATLHGWLHKSVPVSARRALLWSNSRRRAYVLPVFLIPFISNDFCQTNYLNIYLYIGLPTVATDRCW